jgi:hypothetical protein
MPGAAPNVRPLWDSYKIAGVAASKTYGPGGTSLLLNTDMAKGSQPDRSSIELKSHACQNVRRGWP